MPSDYYIYITNYVRARRQLRHHLVPNAYHSWRPLPLQTTQHQPHQEQRQEQGRNQKEIRRIASPTLKACFQIADKRRDFSEEEWERFSIKIIIYSLDWVEAKADNLECVQGVVDIVEWVEQLGGFLGGHLAQQVENKALKKEQQLGKAESDSSIRKQAWQAKPTSQI